MPQQNVREVHYALNRVRTRIEQEFAPQNDEGDPARFLEMRDLMWSLRQTLRAAQEWEARWKRAHRGKLLTNWDLRSDEDRIWLQRTNLTFPTHCNSCGYWLVTEADFAKHYVIGDVNYPNLGICWTRKAQEYLDADPTLEGEG